MKKLILILLIVACLAFAGCEIINEVVNVLLEEVETVETTEATEALQTTEPVEAVDGDVQHGDYNAPTLPELNYDGMNFYDDGYEIVRYSRTTDGDTATFIMGYDSVKCRFVGINTPELDHDNGNHDPFAEEARDATEKLLEEASIIILERDDNAGVTDKYDRLLAHVWVDGELLNYYLVYEGLATTRYLKSNYLHADDIFAAEELSKDAGRGVWGK